MKWPASSTVRGIAISVVSLAAVLIVVAVWRILDAQSRIDDATARFLRIRVAYFVFIEENQRRPEDTFTLVGRRSPILSWRAELLPYLGYNSGANVEEFGPNIDFEANWESRQNQAVDHQLNPSLPFLAGISHSRDTCVFSVQGDPKPDGSSQSRILLVWCEFPGVHWLRPLDLTVGGAVESNGQQISIATAFQETPYALILLADGSVWRIRGELACMQFAEQFSQGRDVQQIFVSIEATQVE